MKKLPNNIQYLELILTVNNLGEKEENMKLLANGIKHLPMNLKTLKLFINRNNLRDNIKYLCDAIK